MRNVELWQGDVGLGFFRAPLGRPGEERQFSGPWALANSSSDVVDIDISLNALTKTTTIIQSGEAPF